jgi:hypothetical protein
MISAKAKAELLLTGEPAYQLSLDVCNWWFGTLGLAQPKASRISLVSVMDVPT